MYGVGGPSRPDGSNPFWQLLQHSDFQAGNVPEMAFDFFQVIGKSWIAWQTLQQGMQLAQFREPPGGCRVHAFEMSPPIFSEARRAIPF